MAAPYPLVADTLGSGAFSGMKTVLWMPSSPAASATPWPWLPALAATTPRARSAADSRDRRGGAPRPLYEPARCWFSHFSQVGAPSVRLSSGELSRGVVRTTPVSSSRAVSMSASVRRSSAPAVMPLLVALAHVRALPRVGPFELPGDREQQHLGVGRPDELHGQRQTI